jgi:hypothetical protein
MLLATYIYIYIMMTVDFAEIFDEICNNNIQGSPVVKSLIRMMPVTTSLSVEFV